MTLTFRRCQHILCVLISLMLLSPLASIAQSSYDSMQPFGFATCTSITDAGNANNITGGGAYTYPIPSDVAASKRVVTLTSTGAAMDTEIKNAITNKDIIIFDGSKGDFIVKKFITLSGLSGKTLLGINNARLATEWYAKTEDVQELHSQNVEKKSTSSGTGGTLSNGVAVDEAAELATRQIMIDRYGDTSEWWRESGIFYITGCTNMIIRNIRFQGPGAMDLGGADLVSIINSCKNIWVDHCEFADGQDGNMDITNESDMVTASWCHFFYTGRSYMHQNTNLCGSSESKTDDDDKLSITWAYNHWDAGCAARMPMARFGRFHMLNNYYNCLGNKTACINPRIKSEFLIEGNNFDSGLSKIYEANSPTKVIWRSNNYVGNSKAFNPSADDNTAASTLIPYSYSTSLAATAVPAHVSENARACLYRSNPRITQEPIGQHLGIGVSATALTVEAEAQNGGSLTYTWYSNTTQSNTDGTQVATGASYTPSGTGAGITYYYCVVSENGGGSVVSNVVAVSHASETTITLSSREETMNMDTPLNITVSSSRSGEYIVESSSDAVATGVMNGNTLTITAHAPGIAVVHVKQAATTDYYEGDNFIKVTVNKPVVTGTKIFSVKDRIGSATVTATTASVSMGTSVVLEGNGVVNLTPTQPLQNGDKIVLEGTVGDSSKPFGVKIYGADGTSLIKDLYITGSTYLYWEVSGLSENQANISIMRYGGTKTTLTTLDIFRSNSAAYTVTFDAGTNGTCSTSSLTEASANAGVTLPTATGNTGYTFVGWATTNGATSANLNGGDRYFPSENVTLYAVYDDGKGPTSLTTAGTYVNNGFTLTVTGGSTDSNTARFGTASSYETITGRWKSGGASGDSRVLTGNTSQNGTLYVYVRSSSSSETNRTLTIRQGSTTLINAKVIKDADAVKVTEGEKEVDVFPVVSCSVISGTEVSFSWSGGLNFYGFKFVPEGSDTPDPEPKKYDVKFYDGDVQYGETQSITENTTVSAPTSPTKSGYTFQGWSVTEGGTTAVSFPYTITAATIFYAIWKDNAPESASFTVTFNANGKGTCETTTLTENIEGEGVVLPKPEANDGYKFVGWSTEQNATTVSDDMVNGETYHPTGDITLYAVYDNRVVFYTDGGQSAFMDVLWVATNETVAKPSADPFRSGYTFNYWSATDGGTEAAFPYTITSPQSFYAIWTENPSQGSGTAITWDLTGGTNTHITSNNGTFSANATNTFDDVSQSGVILTYVAGSSDKIENCIKPNGKSSPNDKALSTRYFKTPALTGSGTLTVGFGGTASAVKVRMTTSTANNDNVLGTVGTSETTNQIVSIRLNNLNDQIIYLSFESSAAYFTSITWTPDATDSSDEVTLSPDENYANFASLNGQTKDITFKRTFTTGEWTTLVLPFDVTTAQLIEAFGDDANNSELANIVRMEDDKIYFRTTAHITANVPMLAKISNTRGVDEITFKGVTVKNPVDEMKATSSDGNVELVGTYSSMYYTAVPESAYFLYDGKFYDWSYLYEVSPFTAYILPKNNVSAKGISLWVNGLPTGVKYVNVDKEDNQDDATYNIAGQRVNASAKGLLIRNGKKIFVR